MTLFNTVGLISAIALFLPIIIILTSAWHGIKVSLLSWLIIFLYADIAFFLLIS